MSGSDRLWQAAQLIKAHKAPVLLLAGGNVFDIPGMRGEGFHAASVLQNWGVPAHSIIVEADSRTTQQNAEYAADMLEQLGAKRILLVTSAYHMRRAVSLFQANLPSGIDIIPASSDILVTDKTGGGWPSIFRFLPSAGAFNGTTIALHEYYGLLYYWLTGATDQAAASNG